MRHLGVVALDSRLKRLWVSANNLANLVAVLEEHEGRHSADAELLSYIRDFINVELVEAGVGVLVGHPGGA